MNTHQDPYLFDDEAENHRIGRKLNQNYTYRPENTPSGRHDQSHWDEGNHFHTGPSERGSQNYSRQQQRPQPYPQQSSQQHYGNRPNSAYRHPESKLNFGENYHPQQQTAYDRYHPAADNRPNRQFSGHEDFKADDYRYGSGHYNWNRVSVHPGETPNRTYNDYNDDYAANRHPDEHSGFFGRITDSVRNAWNDVTDWRDDEDDAKNYRNPSGYPENQRNYKLRSEPENNARRGYESGPRWADEHRPHPNQSTRTRWPEDHNPNRRGQHQGYNPDPNNY